MLKVIAFDLDDTLYPEREYVLSGFRSVAELARRRFKVEDFYLELVKTFSAGERMKSFNATFERLGIEYDETVIQDLIRHYRAHFPNIKLFDDAVLTLQQLRKKHHLALITDGYLQAQRNKVRALNIERFFEKIIYTDQYGKEYWKPSRFPFQMVMEYFSVEGNECAYVGDNMEKDFIGPNRLGWLTVQIKGKDGQYLNDVNCDDCEPQVRINSLKELGKLLKGD
jgi:putative hydrolase of the HAD superfamily